MKCFHKTRHKTLFVLNCQSKNCVVCGSRIDSIKKTDLIKKTDSIVMKIDSICATFNSIVSTIDSVKKTDSIMSMQNHQLNGVPRSTLILPCLSQSSNNQVDPSTIESILQQSSRFAHPNHTHWTYAEIQSAKQAGLQTHLLHYSP